MSDYNFEMAFQQAFPNPRHYEPMTLEASGPTLSATPGTNPPAYELVAGKSTPGQTPSSALKAASASPGSPPSAQSTGRRTHDPVGDFNFVITIDGVEAGAFQKCDGLSFEVDLIEYRESTDIFPRKRPGIKRFGNLKLAKGYVLNSALWGWCESIQKGKQDRRNGSIQVLADTGDSGEPLVTYEFREAFPIRWSGFKLSGVGKGAMVEEIELAVEQVLRSA